MLHEDKAIVSDIHGTTRDVIEDTTQINGITFRFIDTAGIRKTDDTIENLGIERTYQKLNEAAIVLWLLDEQPSQQETEEMKQYAADKKIIVVQNKIDLSPTASPIILTNCEPFAQLTISAKHRTGISQLEQLVYDAAEIPEITENDVIITSARHYAALTAAHDTLVRIIEAMQHGLSGDLIAEDLRICLEQLAEITGGQITPHEVLGNIFKHFCIGK